MRTFALTAAHGAGRLVLAVAACGSAVTAAAQEAPPLKPGLWEMRGDRTFDGKKITAANATRLCLTPGSFDALRAQNQVGRCKTSFSSRTASGWKWHTTCTQPTLESDGEAAFGSAESYTLKVASVLSMPNRPERKVSTDMKGKWLAASCGDVKPLQLARPPR